MKSILGFLFGLLGVVTIMLVVLTLVGTSMGFLPVLGYHGGDALFGVTLLGCGLIFVSWVFL